MTKVKKSLLRQFDQIAKARRIEIPSDDDFVALLNDYVKAIDPNASVTKEDVAIIEAMRDDFIPIQVRAYIEFMGGEIAILGANRKSVPKEAAMKRLERRIADIDKTISDMRSMEPGTYPGPRNVTLSYFNRDGENKSAYANKISDTPGWRALRGAIILLMEEKKALMLRELDLLDR